MQGQRGGSTEAQAPLAGLQLVHFRDVLENVVQEAHAGLARLAERLPTLEDQERKRELLEHLQTTRQRLQRLHVCAQWAHKAKAVNTCREVLKSAQDHGAALMHAADALHHLHAELVPGRVPLFDVSAALHISQTGQYRLLPRAIEDELKQPGQRLERPGEMDEAQRAQRRRDALRRMDFLLRSKLLAGELPPGMRVQRVRGGQVDVAAAGGQYTATLSLVPAPPDEVTLSKFRPPGEPEDGTAVKEEAEVTQPAAGGEPSTSAAATQAPGPSSAAAAAAAAEPGGPAQQPAEGPDRWRWRLLSFELLPAAAVQGAPALSPAQQAWLQEHVTQHVWAAHDAARLVQLGKRAWVTVPAPASAAKEQQQGQPSAWVPSSGPAPSSSLAASHAAAGAGSLAAADGKGKQAVKAEPEQDEQQQQQQPAALDLPRYATDPLAVMHSILCLVASRLALFSILLSDAKQLEGGSWKGSLKLSRSGDGKGIRLSYWNGLPCVGHAELACLREQQPYQPDAATAASPGPQQQQQQVAPAVEVAEQEDGSLLASSVPQLRHALTGDAVQLALPLDDAASLSADRLLLEAAARSAALQLAAVHAALQQRGQLAPCGVHAELSLPASSAGAAGAAVTGPAPLPVSPQLHLWCGGSLQLSLGVQLRTGRLLLVAGPALLESEQGSDAAAAVAAVQQQLDQTQRDAMSQPVPPGSTRGMLAANRVAALVAQLSMQLSMRRRIDCAAAASAACGLRRAALPQQLLSQYLRQVSLLLAPPSSNLLTLALPAFPPPADMQRWARQQQRRQGGGGSAVADSGATRCFLLLDFGDPAAAAAGEGRQQAATGAGEHALPRMLLAVCSCTTRGTVTRVLQLADLPAHVLAEAQAAAGEAAGGGANASRKRRASDAAAAGQALPEQPAPAWAVAGSAASSEFERGLTSVVAWCRRQASWEALRSQLAMLPVQHAEELPLGQPTQQRIRLPKAPVLAQVEAWALTKLAAAEGPASPAGPLPKPAASMQLDGEEEERAAGGAGGWRVDLASAYFGRLPELLRQQGVLLVPPAADAQHVVQHGSGLTLRYSLSKGMQGHSVLTAITDLVRLGMLHTCLTRLAGSMAANPLAPRAKPGGGSNGALPAADGVAHSAPTNGGLHSKQQWPGGAMNGGCAPLVWRLPGCGSVSLVEAGLSHLLLLLSPPPLPDSLQHLEQPEPLRVTVSWDNTLLIDSPADPVAGSSGGGGGGGGTAVAPAAGAAATVQRGGSAAPRGVATPPAMAAATAATAAAPGGSVGGAVGSLRHIRCRVASQPPLPEPVAAALGQQLEAGRADLFLDSLCLAGHAAAAAAGQLAPQALQAAGLLPGAFKLHGAAQPGAGGAGTGAAGAAASQGSSALRLRAQLQQGRRAASLGLGFHPAGYALLQLSPVQQGATAAASSWVAPLWEQLAKTVPTFATADATPAASQPTGAAPGEQPRPQQQPALRQAWVHHSGVPAALAAVLRAVADTAA